MRHIFKGSKIHTLVMTVFATSHVTMVPDDFSNVLRWHVFFLSIHKAEFALLGKTL